MKITLVVSTNMMYHFACRCKDVHLCFIMSPVKICSFRAMTVALTADKFLTFICII